MGGTHIGDDKKSLNEGVHIVVGTPGRICDLMKVIFQALKQILERHFGSKLFKTLCYG